jgi:predicted Zn-dependent protease
MLLLRLLSAVVLLLATAASAADEASDARLAELSRHLEARPQDADTLLARADLHRRRGDFEAALRDLDRAAALVPANPPELVARGRLFLDWDRPADAVPPLQTLVSRHRDHIPGRTTLARALCAQARMLESEGKAAEARKAWELGLWHLEHLPLYLRSTTTLTDLEIQAREALARLAS